MHSSKALRQLTESDDPRLREIGFKLLQRGTGKFKELLYPDKPLGRALGSLAKKGTLSREGKLFTGKPDPEWVPDKEFSAYRLGGIGGGDYPEAVTHYRSGIKPSQITPLDRDRGRLRLYSEAANPAQRGFWAHSHPGGTPASPESISLTGQRAGDAAFMSDYPNVDFPIVETPRAVEDIVNLRSGEYGVRNPFGGEGATRTFKSEEAADEFRRSFGGGTEVPENWQGTLDQYRFGEIEAGKGYDSPGPSAFRRATAALFPKSEAGLSSLADEALVELQKRFPNIPIDTLGGEIIRVMQAKQAENYPENLDYTYHSTDPEMFQDVQKVVEDIGGGALSKLKLPE
jgi:hypothetical protein